MLNIMNGLDQWNRRGSSKICGYRVIRIRDHWFARPSVASKESEEEFSVSCASTVKKVAPGRDYSSLHPLVYPFGTI